MLKGNCKLVGFAEIGGLILLVLNVWVIAFIISTFGSIGLDITESLLVIVVPLIGFTVWLTAGPRPTRKPA